MRRAVDQASRVQCIGMDRPEPRRSVRVSLTFWYVQAMLVILAVVRVVRSADRKFGSRT